MASIDFRNAPEAPYPASLQDINLAIRWLKAHAREFGTTADRVGVYGWSSGGHQALLATLRAEPLTKKPRDFEIDYTLRDRAGHTWSAFPWHTTIYYGGTDPAYVMGLVPSWAAGSFELVMGHQHQDLSPPLGGPRLVFLR